MSMTEEKTSASGDDATPPKPIVPIDQSLFGEVRVAIEAQLGHTEMTVDALMALKSGSIVTLQTGLADHVDLYVNGACVARGEIVAVGDQFGVRITEVASER